MLRRLVSSARELEAAIRLPRAAKLERRRDLRRGLGSDPGTSESVSAALAWLGVAQDRSTSADGGVARHFSLIDGWAPSYPETTGYIVPTMLSCAQRMHEPEFRERGLRMLDWLVAIQHPDGGFQGGVIGATPKVSVTFNTGQILLGLADGVARESERYRDAMRRAADWLVQSQDPDGAWRRHPTPFAAPGEKVYETHVAWGLLEADRQDPARGYAEAALRNVRWALTHQQTNGWFAHCCLEEPDRPLTHTLGYVLRGIIEAHRYSGEEEFLKAARRTADSLLGVLRADGWLPARLDATWGATVDFVCLTGTVQIAHCWLQLYAATGEPSYRDAAYRANAFVRRAVRTEGPPELRGAVKGSFPVSGSYGQYQYLNWAAKFFIDSNLLEADTRERES